MRYTVDHDLHIHSQISSCSRDPEQTNERILQYAEKNGLNTLCLTDHFWDYAYGQQERFDWMLKQQNVDTPFSLEKAFCSFEVEH